MRPALGLLESGISQAQTARLTGIPRSTIRTWLARGPAKSAVVCPPCSLVEAATARPEYAYLLGLYLGDGSISSHPRGVYNLRVTLDLRYPGIIAECQAAMARVVPGRVGRAPAPGCVHVYSYSKHWPCLFPQHGPGPKHLRPIVLEPWQRELALGRHPELLLRGLIHSDGWRGTNVAVTPQGRYFYPRYLFSNRSDDIRRIFAEACAEVGVVCRQSNRWNLSVARREDVARLDQWIGPKQ